MRENEKQRARERGELESEGEEKECVVFRALNYYSAIYNLKVQKEIHYVIRCRFWYGLVISFGYFVD